MSENPASVAPATGILNITPSDDEDLPEVLRAFQVGVSGDVAVVMHNGTAGIIPGCMAGAQYVGYAIRGVMATGTTAEGIVGFY